MIEYLLQKSELLLSTRHIRCSWAKQFRRKRKMGYYLQTNITINKSSKKPSYTMLPRSSTPSLLRISEPMWVENNRADQSRPPCQPKSVMLALYDYGRAYFFSTLTFCESQERPSKMPIHACQRLREGIGQLAALHTFSARRAAGLDFPHVVLGYSVQVERLCYVVWSHRCPSQSAPIVTLADPCGPRLTAVHILLIRKHEQHHIPHLPILYNPPQFTLRLLQPRTIHRINHENQRMSAGEIVSP